MPLRPLPFDLTELQALVAIIEGGSLSRAADQLKSSKSVLSRRIASLEYSFGAQLIVRDRHGARPTVAGSDLHRVARDVLARLEQVHDEAKTGLAELAGPVRITAPLSFGTTYLAPALAGFAAAHPNVALDVSLDDHVVDLLGGGYDLALRIGREPDPALSAQQLAVIRPYVLASPIYLARCGRPQGPDDLSGHDILEYTNEGLNLWRSSFGSNVDPSELNVRFRSDNGDLLCSAAVAGLGLVILPDFLVAQAVAAGKLEIVLATCPLVQAGLHAVPAPGRPKLRRVRALVEHLMQSFGPNPPWALEP